MAYTIYKTCDTCGGDGTAELAIGGPGGGSVPCWHCGETGKLLVGEIPELQANLAGFRSDLQDYLVDWKTEETAAFALVIQKLNQIIAALP